MMTLVAWRVSDSAEMLEVRIRSGGTIVCMTCKYVFVLGQGVVGNLVLEVFYIEFRWTVCM